MNSKNTYILETKNLKKTFFGKKGKPDVEAVKGVTMQVRKGEIFGFLGPNGAGKTTTLQMLTTLLAPTGGAATVVGSDLLKNPSKIRKKIGYVSQVGGADVTTNATENLILQARLYGMDRAEAVSRSAMLVERFELGEFAKRKVSSYSGGQRRRLDLALGIIHKPDLIFLDEPTTGLDPQSRAHFWDEIREIKRLGTTIFLTTHYLDEADNLCDHLAIVDHGTIVAQGTPELLKRQAGGESIIVGVSDSEMLVRAEGLLSQEKYVLKLLTRGNSLYLYVKNGEELLPDVLRFLDRNKIPIKTIELSRPSLDDVFLQHTGKSLRDSGS